ncbi:DNA topoisomerase 3-beta [Hypsibius exemplaris]|uniref:DNA topoisomerase n=1 Tax=Hypsibius exemplaris TaxID=2072580 RepID=A0A1W0W9A2_HYPEX|nr:DNA topoisomerase 3-beta [Hypsibius exemplaris]
MRKVVMVAEKPSLAKTLAGFLSANRCTKGMIDVVGQVSRPLPLFEWDAPWPVTGEIVHYLMSSTYGHINEIEFVEEFRDWRKDPEGLFTCGVMKQPADPHAGVGRQLTGLGRNADFLVLWLDCDKEGENICFEVMDCIVPVMRKSPPMQRIYRAQFSALTAHDIQEALQHLRTPNQDEARSVDARMELDLRIGCAFTRFQTRFFKHKYGAEALRTTTMPFGPCQTPTLGFVVERHMAIQNFQPEPFWQVKVDVDIPGSGVLTLHWKRNRTLDRALAERILLSLRRHRFITVANVTSLEKRKLRPAALNTVQLLRLASSRLGMSPDEAMKIAEKLYMEGFISYPRTETTRYPSSFDRMSTLTNLGGDDEIGRWAAKLIYEVSDSRQVGKDRGDHPPIIPLKKPTVGLRNGDRAFLLYELICNYFLAGLASDCIYLEKTVVFDVEGERFQLDGVEVMEPGYTDILTNERMRFREVPGIAVGSSVGVRDCGLREDATRPPDYLSESDLIDLMEKHEIGTDASIAVHIQSIFKRNFAFLNDQRKIVPTPMGSALIGAYQALDDDLVKPQIRSTLERDLKLIAEGKAKKEEIIQHVLEIYKAKYRYLVLNIGIVDAAIASSLHLTPSMGQHNRQQSSFNNRPSPAANTSVRLESGRSRPNEHFRQPAKRRMDNRTPSCHGSSTKHFRRDEDLGNANEVPLGRLLPPPLPPASFLPPSPSKSSSGYSSGLSGPSTSSQPKDDFGLLNSFTRNRHRNVVQTPVSDLTRSSRIPSVPLASPTRLLSSSLPMPSANVNVYSNSTPSTSRVFSAPAAGGLNRQQPLFAVQQPVVPHLAPAPLLNRLPQSVLPPAPSADAEGATFLVPSTSRLSGVVAPQQPLVPLLSQQDVKAEPVWPGSARVAASVAISDSETSVAARPVVRVEGQVRAASIPPIVPAGAYEFDHVDVKPQIPLPVRTIAGVNLSPVPNLFLNCPALRAYSVQDKDPVQIVHELCSKALLDAPEFRVFQEGGPSHAPHFQSEVMISNRGTPYQTIGPFRAGTKKDAKKQVARVTILAFGFNL